MVDPSKRTLTILLTAAVVILLIAIYVGRQMGSHVLTQVADSGGGSTVRVVTPAPSGTPSTSYGPDWKRTQTLAAAPDPAFPDPRVPPVPLPTPPPVPKSTPTPHGPTPNPNLPIWDRSTPIPSESPSSTPATSESPPDTGHPSATPEAGKSPTPTQTLIPTPEPR